MNDKYCLECGCSEDDHEGIEDPDTNYTCYGCEWCAEFTSDEEDDNVS